MTIRMTSQDFVTKKIYVLYVPIILLVIHGFMLMNDIAIWLNFATPLMIIVSAITLIPIFIERTPNFRTVFFYMIGLFLFGIAEAIWSVIIGIFHQLPSENVYLACFYTLPNFCFFAAAIAYLQVNRKYFNPAQLIQDLISSTLLGVGFFLMVFFDTQLFGNIDIGISNVSNFMFLLCNTLIMTILIAMGLSLRICRLRWGDTTILIALMTFFLADSFYVSAVANSSYVPYGLLDWLYIFSLLSLSTGIKISYMEFKELSKVAMGELKQNEGPVRHVWLFVIIPILNILMCGLHLKYMLYFALVIIIHLILSLHIQKHIHMEKILKTNVELNVLLQEKVEERTLQLRTMNDNLAYMLKHDNLTGLQNRDHFFDSIDEILLKCNPDHIVYLLVLDIDHFRTINELYGDYIGDKILIEVAARLNEFCKNKNSLARMYGNEFAILINGPKESIQIHTLIKELFSLFSVSLFIAPFDITINIHVGVASFPENAQNRHDLMRCAKTALGQVKSSKSEPYAFYDEVLHQQECRNQKIEFALRKADINRELELYFQPEYDTAGKTLLGVEALLRWHSSTLGYVSPFEFIPVAEETGLILEIGEWVMKTAMEQIKEWNMQYDTEFFMGINVSSLQLQNRGFIKQVKKLILETGVNARWLNFEITESATLDPHGASVSVLKQLSELGISIAIDDFGTGYSSYGYIKHFSIDILKIDKQLIETITINPNDAQVVKSIIAMASALELKTIAEGVEIKEQAHILKNMNCDIIQGYLFGKPVSAEEFVVLHLAKADCEITA